MPFEEQNIYWALVTVIIMWLLVFCVIHRIGKRIVEGVLTSKDTKNYQKEKISEYKQNLHNTFDKFNEKEKKMILGF